MHDDAKAQVLTQYRQLRGTGMAPFQVMEAIRNDKANIITFMVAYGRQPPLSVLAEWRAAVYYLNSMSARPQWWWQATVPAQPPRRIPNRLRRYLSARPGRSTIPT